ncbi:MAG TPA: hypothetical protein VEC12_00840 [Bacteroidia bacterium]|nr:hypothetical protein [Bacteroidia bacterium]
MPGKKRRNTHRKTRYNGADIALYAAEQNEESLKNQHPNIASVSNSVTRVNGVSTNVVTIYTKDNDTTGMPTELEAKMPDGTIERIATEIITGLGDSKVHFSQVNNVSNSNTATFLGSICCAVKSTTDPGFLGVLTSAHIYTGGIYQDLNGVFDENSQGVAVFNGTPAGIWYLGVLGLKQDLAVVKVNAGQLVDNNYKSFTNGFYAVSNADVQTENPNITVISQNFFTRTAFVVDYNVGLDINYNGIDKFKKNILLIGSTNNRETSKTVSKSGDSGSCVYHSATGKLIGMLLGGNDKFSFVLPIQNTLDLFNLKTI